MILIVSRLSFYIIICKHLLGFMRKLKYYGKNLVSKNLKINIKIILQQSLNSSAGNGRCDADTSIINQRSSEDFVSQSIDITLEDI